MIYIELEYIVKNKVKKQNVFFFNRLWWPEKDKDLLFFFGSFSDETNKQLTNYETALLINETGCRKIDADISECDGKLVKIPSHNILNIDLLKEVKNIKK